MSNLDELLAAEGGAAENNDLPAVLPETVRVDHPNLSRSVVVSVRFSGAEHEKVQRAAALMNLPVSTVLRLWALDRLHADPHQDSVERRLERLEHTVFPRTQR